MMPIVDLKPANKKLKLCNNYCHNRGTSPTWPTPQAPVDGWKLYKKIISDLILNNIDIK